MALTSGIGSINQDKMSTLKENLSNLKNKTTNVQNTTSNVQNTTTGIQKNTKTLQDRISNLQNKTTSLINSASNDYNPYLKSDGSLVNPYINYQNILDGTTASDNTKNFITSATGLQQSARTSPRSEQASAASKKKQESEIKTTATRDAIVSAANSYIGTPYVWGGESMEEGGMDCSGFVYNALKDSGIDYGRTTAQGYRSYGTSVSKSEMKPGDLIFYGSNGKATHVGIYIGNGQMIHSAGGSKNTKSNK